MALYSNTDSNSSGLSKSCNALPMLCESSTDSCLTLEAECTSNNSICFNGCGVQSFPSAQSKSTQTYQSILNEHGYQVLNKICDTLQGELILAKTKFEDGIFHKVAIKRTNKILHERKICIDENGINFVLDENIISEGIILNMISNNDYACNYCCKFIEFFQSEYDHYLVMEYVSSQLTLEQFCNTAHNYINKNILKFEEWNITLKNIFLQLVNTLNYMHNELNISHLDLTMDNILIENGSFVIDDCGNIKINRNVSIKIIDFGLAEMFDPDELICDKQVPHFELNYKSPQIFNDENYNPCKADVWSLGIILYKIIFNEYPYKIQNEMDDKKYNLVLENNIKEIIKMNKIKVSHDLILLFENMLNSNENNRCDIMDVLHHKWLESI